MIPAQGGPPTCRSVGDLLLDCETKEGPFCAYAHPLVAQLINSFKNNRGLETDFWQGGRREQDEGEYISIVRSTRVVEG